MLIFVIKLGQTDHPTSIALWYNFFGAITFFLICILNGLQWSWSSELLLILIIIGFVSSLQQICLAYSHRLAPASLLAPSRYISVPIGIIVGATFFNEILMKWTYGMKVDFF